MADRLQVDPIKLHETLKNTVFRGANDHELLALSVVANAYNLNPLLKEIYAFPGKHGGITPIVSIDGWIRIVNEHPQFDGVEFEYTEEDGRPVSCTAIIHRKDRSRPVKVTEFMAECARGTEPWKQFPRRMLRHKALKEAARVAFGFSGITDEDEAHDVTKAVVVSKPLFSKSLPEPQEVVEAIVEPTVEPIEDVPPMDNDLWDDSTEFVVKTPQDKIVDLLHRAGRSEREFFVALAGVGVKTTARTVKGLSEQLANGLINDWSVLEEAFGQLKAEEVA